MNPRGWAFIAAGAPLFFVILLIVVIFGGAAANTMAIRLTDIAATTGELRPGSVPPWARQPLLNAARDCKAVTAPLLAAQIDIESGWNPKARNPASGAEGLAQFMPAAWAAWGVDGDRDGRADPFSPADAIATQARYLCSLIDAVRHHLGLVGNVVDLALAAYNAGLGNVYRYGSIPPFPETQHYVATIRSKLARYAATRTQSARGQAATVIAAARRWIGTPYAWGGGTLAGPSEGTGPDADVVGFDCSALVRYAVYQGTGGRTVLPRTSGGQYRATAARPVPVDQLRPGDLMFWGIADHVHHVAIYTGHGLMIEAPESGETIHEVPIRIDGDFLGAASVL